MRFPLAVLMCAAMVPAWADASLSFDAAVTRAQERNPALRAARADLLAAEHSARAARSGFLPQVSASLGASEVSGDAADGDATYSAGLTATQNVFSGFHDEARSEQARAALQSAQSALVLAKARLSRDLKFAYAGLGYAQDNVALTESILRRREENLRLVQLRFEGGRENKGATLSARASLAQARLDALEARQDLAAAQAALGRLLGEVTTPWRAAGEVPLATPEAQPDFSALARSVPEYIGAVARERSAAAGVRLARAGYYPSVDLSIARSSTGDRRGPSTERNTVGASISIPIFSGGRDYHGEREALATAESAQASREDLEAGLSVSLRQAYAAYLRSVEQLDVNREFLDAAETRARIARAQYQNGLTTFEEWDRIENELIQRQKTSLASLRDRVTAQAGWELAQGKGVIP